MVIAILGISSRAAANPSERSTRMFAFGRAYGIVIGLLTALGTPMTFVSSVKWKRALDVPSAKDGARARASQLLPQASQQWPLKKDHGKAEAALLALYGAQIANEDRCVTSDLFDGDEVPPKRPPSSWIDTRDEWRTLRRWPAGVCFRDAITEKVIE
jgi:hypothetical protein